MNKKIINKYKSSNSYWILDVRAIKINPTNFMIARLLATHIIISFMIYQLIGIILIAWTPKMQLKLGFLYLLIIIFIHKIPLLFKMWS